MVQQSRIPVGRFGLPGRIASIVEMLVTNPYMTNKVRPSLRLRESWYRLSLISHKLLDCRGRRRNDAYRLLMNIRLQ